MTSVATLGIRNVMTQYTRIGTFARLAALAFALGHLYPTAHAAAQDDDEARAASARALFQEGVELADSSEWFEAADRFRRALTLRDSPVIAYNLASALRQLGQLVEAAELLERIVDNAGADPELRRSAASALADIRPRLGRLSLRIEGRQPGDVIAIDTHRVPDERLGSTLPIDPGTHIVTAARGEKTLHSEPIFVLEGSSYEVTFRLAPLPAPAPRAAALSVAKPTPRSHNAGLESERKPSQSFVSTAPWWLWAGAGALVVGAVAVAAVAASSGDSGNRPVRGDFDPPVLRVQVGK